MKQILVACLVFWSNFAAASPVEWVWGGTSQSFSAVTLESSTWPPAASFPVVGTSHCTGVLHLSCRTTNGAASWSFWVSAMFGDASAPAFVRLLSPAAVWQLSTAQHMCPTHRARIGVDGTIQGLVLQVEGPGTWAGTFNGTCTPSE